MIKTVKKPSKQVSATANLNRYLWVNADWILACSNWWNRDGNDVFKYDSRQNRVALIINLKATINRNSGYNPDKHNHYGAYTNSLKAHIRYGFAYHYGYPKGEIENA